jgi:hypothetical protein
MGYAFHPAGTILKIDIKTIVLTDIYDSNAVGTEYNQPYKVQCQFTGGAFLEWSGGHGSTFELQIVGTPTVVRTYSNTGVYTNNFRVTIVFTAYVKLISGYFHQFKLPAFTWSLYKI